MGHAQKSRENLKARLDALMIEYALSYSHESIRHYLINAKGLTVRQYKRVLEMAPARHWHIRKEEIQGLVAQATLETGIKEIVLSRMAVLRVKKAASEQILMNMSVPNCTLDEIIRGLQLLNQII